MLWETLRAVIRGDIISYSAQAAKKNNQKRHDLLEAIRSLDKQFSLSSSPDLYTQRAKLQSEFDLLSTARAEFLVRRTKGTYYEYGDKASRLLALQFKRQAASRHIPQVYNSSNSLTTDPAEINSVCLLLLKQIRSSCK